MVNLKNFQSILSSLKETEEAANNIPIIKAVLNGEMYTVECLIDSGTDINIHAPGGGKTPLHIAIEQGYPKISLLLIKAKADVNAVTKRGFTPLHVAAQLGYDELVEKLIAAKSNINAVTDVGCTPLHEAAANGHQEVVTTLLKHGADPSIKETKYNLTASDLAKINGHKAVVEVLPSNVKNPSNEAFKQAPIDNKKKKKGKNKNLKIEESSEQGKSRLTL